MVATAARRGISLRGMTVAEAKCAGLVPAERDTKNAITDYLDARKIRWYRLNSGLVPARGGAIHLAKKGTPDLLALPMCKFPDGRLKFEPLFIETKSAGGGLNKDQLRQTALLREEGFYVCAAWSVDAVQQALEEIGAI